jgi:RNA polymerase sigma-70 factor (ECF subfamily)
VEIHQRRASRIAYQYLRDAADADEAVQDAFVKVFSHITSYRESVAVRGLVHAHPHQWLPGSAQGSPPARPLVRGRRGHERRRSRRGGKRRLRDPEHRLLARERRASIAAAIDRLDGRQRTVFMLCHYGDCTPREVSAMTGLNESTVRVHLFRAARKLRTCSEASRDPARTHVQEARLFDVYVAERTGEPVQPPVAEHLADCEACGRRYTELVASWTRCAARGMPRRTPSSLPPASAPTAADRAPRRPRRTTRPRHQLPGTHRPPDHHRLRDGTAPRWIAAAALPDCSSASRLARRTSFRWGGTRAARQSVRGCATAQSARASRVTAIPVRSTGPADMAADEAFLSDLEIALDRPRTRELQAFDELTPHVREIRDR